MRVLKFGGTSVANARRIVEVASIVKRANTEDRVCVVVSALAGVTDRLVEIEKAAADRNPAWRAMLGDIRRRHLTCLEQVVGCRAAGAPYDELIRRVEETELLCSGIQVVGRCDADARDRLLAAGERMSAPIVAAALRASGLEAVAVDATDLIRVGDSGAGAVVDLVATKNLVRPWISSIDASVTPVVTGFVAGDAEGNVRTLGRGGSDLSASVLGAAAEADRVEIWTDVDGVLTAPPQRVAGARTIPRMSYEEAAEMSFFGAAVLHRDTLAPLVERTIPVWVRNTMAPHAHGTLISAFGASHTGATAVAAVGETAVLTFEAGSRFQNPGAAQTLGRLVAALQPEALITSQASSDQALTIIVPGERSRRADEIARQHLSNGDTGVEYRQITGACVVAVVGHDLRGRPRVTARALETFDRHGLELLATASSRHSATFALDAKVLDRVLEALHETLLPTEPTLTKETCDVHEEKGRRSRRHRQRRPAVRSSVA